MMFGTTYLSGDYGYEQYRAGGFAAGHTIDASEAAWIVSNVGDNLNRYPFLIENSGDDLIIRGGTINGEVPLDIDWVDAYVNSAGILVRDLAGVLIEEWSIDRAWDGIRIDGESDGFLVDKIYMTEIRDDAIENDDASSGTISNSLFDGVFSGISLADSGTPDSSEKVVTISNVLMRMESYYYKGELTHSAPLKVEVTSPSLQIYDSIFAIEDVDHIRNHKTQLGWDKTIDASNNYFLNLSDTALPANYPVPGEGWTVLEGEEARTFWESARDAWIAEYADLSEDPTPVADGESEAQEAEVEESSANASDDGSEHDDLIDLATDHTTLIADESSPPDVESGVSPDWESSATDSGDSSSNVEEEPAGETKGGVSKGANKGSKTSASEDDAGGLFGKILAALRAIFGPSRNGGEEGELMPREFDASTDDAQSLDMLIPVIEVRTEELHDGLDNEGDDGTELWL